MKYKHFTMTTVIKRKNCKKRHSFVKFIDSLKKNIEDTGLVVTN